MISIITVTYKSEKDIVRLIKSIKKFITSDYEIIVFDSDSQDNTPKILNEMFPEVQVIASEENLGYARGMNAGYSIAKGEYIAFMNPDMEVKNDIFKPLIDEIDSDNSIGIIAPQLKYGDGTVQPTVKRDPTLFSQVLILLKLHHFISSPVIYKYLAKDFDYTKVSEVEQLMGAFIFTKRERYEKFGPWDARYPLWWEDVQLCKDSRKAGYKNIYYPSVSLTHFEGNSFAQVMSVEKQHRFNKGVRKYFLYNHSIFHYLVLLIIDPISIGLARIVQFLKIKPKTQSKL